jgi:hypothetical protein
MSRKRVTRQRPVHLDHFRRENDTRACLRANILTTPNGSVVENCFKDIGHNLNSYPIIYVDEKIDGLDLNSNDTGKVTSAEGDYVTLTGGGHDGISNISSLTNCKDSLNDSGRGSDLKHINEDITPVNGIYRHRNSDDGFNDGDDVYVTLVSDNITFNDAITGEEQDSGNGDEIDIRNISDSFYSPNSQYVGGILSAKAITEPLSPQVKYQPYLKLEPFSDTESLLSAEVHRTEYLKQLKEFEHSIDGAVWRRKVWQMESKGNDAQEKSLEDASIAPAGECSESVASGGEKIQPEADDNDTNIKSSETGSDEKVSLEDIIQDFLQYFQTKRHSVKTNHGSILSNELDTASEHVDSGKIENLQDELQADLPLSEKGRTVIFISINLSISL